MANYSLQQLESELKRREQPSNNDWSLGELEAELSSRENSTPGGESTLNRMGRSLARIPRNAAASLADVGDFIASPVREGLNLGAKALGMREIPTLANEITNSIDTATGGYTKPQTNPEKVEEAIQRGLISLPFGGALGTAAKGIKNLPNIEAVGNFLRGSNAVTPANVLGTAATTGAIQSSMNENPQDIAGAALSGIGSGMGAAALPSVASILTKKGRTGIANTVGQKLKVNPQAVESFNKSGITPTLADVSESSPLKIISSKLEKLPVVGGNIKKTKELQRNQVLQGLRQGDQDFLSKSDASELVKKGSKNYQRSKTTEFGKIFDRVEEDIDKLPDSLIGKEKVDKFFEKTFKNIKTKSQQKKFEKSPLGQMYIDLYETAKENGGKLPYHYMKDVLDEVNNKITTHGLIGKVDQGKLKQYASHISQSIEEGLEPKFKGLGEESYKNWKQAKKLYGDYAQNDIPKLNELYKKDKKGATDAFIDLVTNQKKGAEKAKIVLQGLDHKDQLALTDAIHKQIGRSSDGSFSSLKWVRGFKDLDPKAQKVLLSPLKDSDQKKIHSIADTMDHLKGTLAEANTSATSYHHTIGALAGATGVAAVSFLSGNPMPAAKLATGLFLGKVASEKLLTNPKFINWIDKGMKAKNLEHFQKILNHIPKVGESTKALTRTVQTFQHDLNLGKKDKKNQG